ncbi:hypothetical protein LPJ81_000137 [Coemansia sp. IMI 209127]|nr:hypothetical protein LPJ81_000137 [Coemansia sp. IMI 209127]
MVEGFGIAKNPKDVAFYSSLLFTSSALGQALTIMYWGRLSDRIGRRPILFIGLTGNLVSFLIFGLSKSFWVALAARSLNGLLSGNVVIIKSILAEISDDTNRARMMAFLPLMWNVGSIAGAAVGGIFADPAYQYPGLFGDIQFFQDYPYFLPCAISCSVTFFSLIMAVFKLKETLVRKNKGKPRQAQTQTPSASSSARSSSTAIADENTLLLAAGEDQEAQVFQNPKQRSLRELMTPTVARVMGTNILICLAMSVGDQIYPIFAATSTDDGGLGFEARSIGFSLSIATIAVFYVQLFVYPRLERKYGALFCYQRGQMLMIIPYIALPFLSILSAHLEKSVTDPRFAMIALLPDKWDRYTIAEYAALWIMLVSLLLLLTVAKILAATSINILTVNIAPSQSDLGSMNGAQQMAMTVTRIIGPLITGTVWTWSIKHSLPFPFNSHCVWTVAAALALTSYYSSRNISQSVNTFAAGKDDGNDEPADSDS